MNSLIITSGNAKYFTQLKNFVDSLRGNGAFTGIIAVCDNAISGKWDAPGTWDKEESFNNEQLQYFKQNKVQVYPIQELIADNQMDENVIRAIKSPTQRYPYKFIYNVLISKKYLDKVEEILYFDSDIYFQAPVAPIFAQAEDGKILIVKEWLKMKDNHYLDKWLKFSDFSKVSTQEHFLGAMLPAENYCSGFYGSKAATFHRFNVMALLLTSNQFVNFYSDQPLINILKTFFFYPFKELDWSYCLHLGELDNSKYAYREGKISLNGEIPISVHFNSGKYKELESMLAGKPLPPPAKASFAQMVYRKIKKTIS